MKENKLIVVAIGGNSLIEDNKTISIANQYEAARKTATHIVRLIAEGNKVVVVHGNGPQVGFALLRSERSKDILHTESLDICVANTQGVIGYQLQMALYNEASKANLKLDVATVVSQVEIDKNDPALKQPSKPIGLFMDEKEAALRAKEDNWNIIEDSSRGYRRVVASPKPKAIIELNSIKTLVNNNVTVIAAGGGGVAVLRNENNQLEGFEAVIDKDLAAALLAKELGADLLVISTAVQKVYLNYNKENQKPLNKITVKEAQKFIEEGHFGLGSMLPKIEAAINFVQNSTRKAIITNYENLYDAIYLDQGTKIVASI